MVKAEQIPPEVVEAFLEATPRWHHVWNVDPSVAEALATALNAWAGMMDATKMVLAPEGPRPVPAIILPLPQEYSNGNG